jgi:hypothetical protein
VPSGKYFRRTQSFAGFNRVLSGANTSAAMFVAPSVFYGVSLLRKDTYGQQTFLLAGEAVLDSEVLTTVMKDLDRRMKPIEVPVTRVPAIASSVGRVCRSVPRLLDRALCRPPSTLLATSCRLRGVPNRGPLATTQEGTISVLNLALPPLSTAKVASTRHFISCLFRLEFRTKLPSEEVIGAARPVVVWSSATLNESRSRNTPSQISATPDQFGNRPQPEVGSLRAADPGFLQVDWTIRRLPIPKGKNHTFDP